MAFACTKSSKKTGVPTEDLAWLKGEKTEMASQNCECIPSIFQATYEGRTIYFQNCRGPACNCAAFYYERDGKQLVTAEGVTTSAFQEKLSNQKLIWSCE